MRFFAWLWLPLAVHGLRVRWTMVGNTVPQVRTGWDTQRSLRSMSPTELEADQVQAQTLVPPSLSMDRVLNGFVQQELQFFGFAANLLFVSFIVSAVMSAQTGVRPGMMPTLGGGLVNNDPYKIQKLNVSRSEWGGSPEVFEECADIVTFFNQSERFRAFNVSLPRGFLIQGPPGCGKTQLARIIASECGANFVAVSGADFVELFVGNGARKVRNLFAFARQNVPCVIFIDEIDAIGKKRSVKLNNNDDQEQTLNQLLYEMDGFNANDEILVLAATNRRDVLDEALLRPGRFDRVIEIPKPDRASRRAILDLYLGKRPLAENVNVDALVELTTGLSGADLKNVVNEAAIACVKRNASALTTDDLVGALEKTTVGISRQRETRTEATLQRVSYHELGHALMVSLFPEHFVLDKVSIMSTYSGAEGYTLFHETQPELQTKELLTRRILVAFGGYAAEKVFYGGDRVSTGSSQDIRQANQLAYSMIGALGFGTNLVVGPSDSNSEVTRCNIDAEVQDLLAKCLAEAVSTVEYHREEMLMWSRQLMAARTLVTLDPTA
jgi:cell division protease FtsH